MVLAVIVRQCVEGPQEVPQKCPPTQLQCDVFPKRAPAHVCCGLELRHQFAGGENIRPRLYFTCLHLEQFSRPSRQDRFEMHANSHSCCRYRAFQLVRRDNLAQRLPDAYSPLDPVDLTFHYPEGVTVVAALAAFHLPAPVLPRHADVVAACRSCALIDLDGMRATMKGIEDSEVRPSGHLSTRRAWASAASSSTRA